MATLSGEDHRCLREGIDANLTQERVEPMSRS